MRKLAFILCVCCFITCRSSKLDKPSKSQREHYLKAYVEILLLQKNFANQTAVIQDSTEKILETHQLTQLNIDKIVAYYDEKPKRWNRFFNKALELLETDYHSVPSQQDPLPKARVLINKSSGAVRR